MIGWMAVELGEDRRARNRRTEAELVRSAVVVVAVPPVVLAVLAGILTRNVLVVLAVLVAVGAGLALWAWTTVTGYGASVVARAGSTLTEEAQPRLHNLVDGLCVANGLAKPTIVEVDGPGCNIANVTVGHGSSATNALIVSAPLLAALSRIELEGVVAQQLSQFHDGSSSVATLVAALGSTAPFGSVLAGRLAAATEPDPQVLADLAGVRLTRYPPGLASALHTIGSGSTEIRSADAATASLWLADPLAPGSPRDDEPASLEVRVATLREL